MTDDPRALFRQRERAVIDAMGVDARPRDVSIDVAVPVETVHVIDTAPDVPDTDADVADTDADVPDTDADVADTNADVPDTDADVADTAGSRADEPDTDTSDTVIFLPGATQPGAAYLPLIAELPDDYRYVTIDHPGDGLTDMVDYGQWSFDRVTRELYPAVLDALGVDAAHVVAHSQGGFQAFRLAFDRPERVRSLALLGAPGGLTRAGPLLFRLLAAPVVGRLLWQASTHDDPAAVRDDWDGQLVTDASAIPRELCALQVANEALPGRINTQASLSKSLWSLLGGTREQYVYPDRVRELQTPTLFVWGSEDFYRPPDTGRPIAQAMADATFTECPGLGHTVWLEPDDPTARELAEFLP